MELNEQNYYSVESNKEYMSASQFKDFVKCEVEALAKVNGEIEETPSPAMLFGSYVDAYGYDIQGAIYQEIVRQNIGKQLPFILAVTTKEENPDKALIQIDQYWLDKALNFVKERCERYNLIKQGVITPVGCGRCPTCRKDLKVTEIVSYETLFNKVREEENDE